MGIKINFSGIEVTVGSADEAAALLRQLADKPSVAADNNNVRKLREPREYVAERNVIKPRGSRLPVGFELVGEPNEHFSSEHQMIFDFLNAIAQADEDGIGQEEMMKAIKVEHPKGIGGRSVRINNWLLRKGFELEDVYETRKTATGRVWRSRRRIQEAIGELI
jgi:hypothetical protein